MRRKYIAVFKLENKMTVNKYTSTLLITSCLLSIILGLSLPMGVQAGEVVGKKSPPDRQPLGLTEQQLRLLDKQVMKGRPDCGVVYNKRPGDVSITGQAIYSCYNSVNWPRSLKLSSQQRKDKHLLDRYFISRMSPYLVRLSKAEQSKFFRQITNWMPDDPYLIPTLIRLGLPTTEVLLQQLKYGTPASCTTYRFFLNKNLALYQQITTLNEPIAPFNEDFGPAPSYRWEDLHYLAEFGVKYSSYCNEEVKKLAKVSPTALNKKRRVGGATPLHLYLSGSHSTNPNALEVIQILITPVNINMKSDYGNTPLHQVVEGYEDYCLDQTHEAMIKLLIARGANVNLKNNAGKTAKELIAQARTKCSE